MARESTSEPNNKMLRCAEAGFPECKWQASGRSEEDVMRQVEQHGREVHGLKLSEDQKQALRHRIRAA